MQPHLTSLTTSPPQAAIPDAFKASRIADLPGEVDEQSKTNPPSFEEVFDKRSNPTTARDLSSKVDHLAAAPDQQSEDVDQVTVKDAPIPQEPRKKHAAPPSTALKRATTDEPSVSSSQQKNLTPSDDKRQSAPLPVSDQPPIRVLASAQVPTRLLSDPLRKGSPRTLAEQVAPSSEDAIRSARKEPNPELAHTQPDTRPLSRRDPWQAMVLPATAKGADPQIARHMTPEPPQLSKSIERSAPVPQLDLGPRAAQPKKLPPVPANMGDALSDHPLAQVEQFAPGISGIAEPKGEQQKAPATAVPVRMERTLSDQTVVTPNVNAIREQVDVATLDGTKGTPAAKGVEVEQAPVMTVDAPKMTLGRAADTYDFPLSKPLPGAADTTTRVKPSESAIPSHGNQSQLAPAAISSMGTQPKAIAPAEPRSLDALREPRLTAHTDINTPTGSGPLLNPAAKQDQQHSRRPANDRPATSQALPITTQIPKMASDPVPQTLQVNGAQEASIARSTAQHLLSTSVPIPRVATQTATGLDIAPNPQLETARNTMLTAPGEVQVSQTLPAPPNQSVADKATAEQPPAAQLPLQQTQVTYHNPKGPITNPAVSASKQTALRTPHSSEARHLPADAAQEIRRPATPAAPTVSTLTGTPTQWLKPVIMSSDSSGQREVFSPELTTTELRQVAAPNGQHLQNAPSRADLPAHVARQLVEVLQQGSNRPVEISLKPAELGAVRMSLQQADAGIVVHLTAERPETLELLRRNIDQLGQEFLELGYSDIAFAFAGGDAENNTEQDTDNTSVDAPSDSSGPTPDIAPATQIHLGPAADGGVDIRI